MHMYTIIQKLGISTIILKKLRLLFSKDTINWSNVTVKALYCYISSILIKLFFLTRSKNPERKMYPWFPQKYLISEVISRKMINI